MIPEEFQEYFQESNQEIQQSIITSLLGFMDSSAVISSKSDRALSCPHCESKRLRANGKLKEVQRYVCIG